MKIRLYFVISFLILPSLVIAQGTLLSELKSPVLFKGDEETAYRDPAVLYENGKFYLFFTYVKTEQGRIYSYTATSNSTDLQRWSPVRLITPKNQDWDFCSPGNVIKYNDEWVLCLQTYPRPDYTAVKKPQYGNGNSRLFIMRSKDLVHWGTPELLKVKGPAVSFAAMGRMIDPYLIADRHVKGKWWCFYKQSGINMSYSYDLSKWVYSGKVESGENPCVLYKGGEYLLFYSPKNGIGIKTSTDMQHWTDWGRLITLGQPQWDWARGRITAGAIVDLTANKKFNYYLLFFHGSGPLTEEEGDFDKNSSIGIAWSKDLVKWDWPGK